MVRFASGCFLFVLVVLPAFGGAEPWDDRKSTRRRPLLVDRGSSVREVLDKLGPPLEKRELEVKRREVWRYDGVEFIFADGKVVDRRVDSSLASKVEGASPESASSEEKPSITLSGSNSRREDEQGGDEVERGGRGHAPPRLKGAPRDIFTDIAREGGSEDEAAGGQSGAPQLGRAPGSLPRPPG